MFRAHEKHIGFVIPLILLVKLKKNGGKGTKFELLNQERIKNIAQNLYDKMFDKDFILIVQEIKMFYKYLKNK